MKKIIKSTLAVIFSAAILFGYNTMAMVFGSTENAMFVTSAGFYDKNSEYSVVVKFDQTLATGETDILVTYGDYVVINGKTVSDIKVLGADTTMKFALNNGEYVLMVAIPKSLNVVKADANSNIIIVKKGIKDASNAYITTCDVKYNLGESGSMKGVRIYRQDNDFYKDTTITSIASPSGSNGVNFIFKVAMDSAITSRKLVNVQFREKSHFLGLTTAGYPFTQTEIDLFYNYGIITKDNLDSLLYKIQFGCEEFNDSIDYDSGTAMSAMDRIDDIQLWSVEQIQRKVEGKNASSQRPLAVQMHFEDNNIEFALKGDSNPEDYGGIDYNLAPNLNQAMVFRIKAGMLFPNGSMVKEDVTFKYNNVTSTWSNISNGSSSENYEDNTLKNQGGYTAEEIAVMLATAGLAVITMKLVRRGI